MTFDQAWQGTETCTEHSLHWFTMTILLLFFPTPSPSPVSLHLVSAYCFSPSSYLLPLLPSWHAFSEPLSIDDGGHMTKGAAPGHVCVSTALPGTMTRTHATWRRMLTKKLKNPLDICLTHLVDRLLHVWNGFHQVWLCSVQPTIRPKVLQSQRSVSTGYFCRYYYLLIICNMGRFCPPRCVIFSYRGWCFVHFVWASAVA